MSHICCVWYHSYGNHLIKSNVIVIIINVFNDGIWLTIGVQGLKDNCPKLVMSDHDFPLSWSRASFSAEINLTWRVILYLLVTLLHISASQSFHYRSLAGALNDLRWALQGEGARGTVNTGTILDIFGALDNLTRHLSNWWHNKAVIVDLSPPPLVPSPILSLTSRTTLQCALPLLPQRMLCNHWHSMALAIQ